MIANRILIFGALALCIVTAITVGVWLPRSSANKTAVGDPKNTSAADNAGKKTSVGDAAKAALPQSSEVRAGLEAVFAGLEKA